MTQKEAIKLHLQKCGSISNVEAQMMYKIRALPRRISDLEADGFEITRIRKVDVTGQRYVRYVLSN